MHVDKLSLSVGHLNIEECWPMCLVTHLAFGILHEAICPPYSPTSNNNASYPHKKKKTHTHKKKKTHTHTPTTMLVEAMYVSVARDQLWDRLWWVDHYGVRLDHVCTSAFLCFYLFFFFFFFLPAPFTLLMRYEQYIKTKLQYFQ